MDRVYESLAKRRIGSPGFVSWLSTHQTFPSLQATWVQKLSACFSIGRVRSHDAAVKAMVDGSGKDASAGPPQLSKGGPYLSCLPIGPSPPPPRRIGLGCIVKLRVGQCVRFQLGMRGILSEQKSRG